MKNETVDFVKDHKSLIKKANESFEQISVLESLNDSLWEAVLSTDVMSIVLQTYSVEDDERLRAETSVIVSKYENALAKLEKENVSYFKQLDRKNEECKYDKLSYERAYTDMKEQNDLLRAQLERLKGKSVDTKFAKPSTSDKPNTSNTVEKPKMSISRFAPKVDEKRDFTKPVTPKPLPKQKEFEKIVENVKVIERNTNVLTSGFSRNSTPHMTTNTVKESVGSNANSSSNKNKFSNDYSDKVKIVVLNKNVEFVYPTCQKCVFLATHDACLAQFLKQGKSSFKARSTKTPKRNKPVVHKEKDRKPIPKDCSFSNTESSAASDKKTTSRSYLRWIPTGRVFKTIGLRWIPTGRIFDSCTKTNNSDNHQKEVETTITVDSQHPQSDDSCTSNTVICETSSSLIAGASTISEPISSEGSKFVNFSKSFFQSSIFDFPFLL